MLDESFEIGAVAFFLVVFLVVAGAANAVNLTDGLDGLAAGIAAIVLLSYTGIAFVAGQNDLAIFGATLFGVRWLPLVQPSRRPSSWATRGPTPSAARSRPWP